MVCCFQVHLPRCELQCIFWGAITATNICNMMVGFITKQCVWVFPSYKLPAAVTHFLKYRIWKFSFVTYFILLKQNNKANLCNAFHTCHLIFAWIVGINRLKSKTRVSFVNPKIFPEILGNIGHITIFLLI